MHVFVLFVLLGVTGCAPSASGALAPAHPASPEAPSTAGTMAASALPPAPAPVLPPALRAAPAAAEPAAMDHAAMGHDAARPAAPLPDVLVAYLAVHDALASDDLAGATAHGAHVAAAFGTLTGAPPAGDPHVWHRHSADVEGVEAAATALATAGDLAAARAAFGRLSAPFARLVEAAGLDRDAALVRATCGMFPGVPEGGVWLQRAGDLRNPYFGAAMLACGTRDSAADPIRTEHVH